MIPNSLTFNSSDSGDGKWVAHALFQIRSDKSKTVTLDHVECTVAGRNRTEVQTTRVAPGVYRAVFSYDPADHEPIRTSELNAAVDWFTLAGPVDVDCGLYYGR
jgi:hypothetical protein